MARSHKPSYHSAWAREQSYGPTKDPHNAAKKSRKVWHHMPVGDVQTLAMLGTVENVDLHTFAHFTYHGKLDEPTVQDPKEAFRQAVCSVVSLHKGDAEGALEEAVASIELDNSLTKAHCCKGAALYSLQRYEESFAAYETGRKQGFPNEAELAEIEDGQAKAKIAYVQA